MVRLRYETVEPEKDCGILSVQYAGILGFYFGMGDADMGKSAGSVSIIGGADGPTSIFIAGKAAR